MAAKKIEIERSVDIKVVHDSFGYKISFIRKAMREYDFPYHKEGRNTRFLLSRVENWRKQFFKGEG